MIYVNTCVPINLITRRGPNNNAAQGKKHVAIIHTSSCYQL